MSTWSELSKDAALRSNVASSKSPARRRRVPDKPRKFAPVFLVPSPAAFGAIATSWPPDPVTLAETLVHEFQHVKLCGLLDRPQNLVSYHLGLLRSGGLVSMHRSSFDGRDAYYSLNLQRYGGFIWSGDTQSRWETLKAHVPVAINTGLSGLPLWGTDIGGEPTDALP